MRHKKFVVMVVAVLVLVGGSAWAEYSDGNTQDGHDVCMASGGSWSETSNPDGTTAYSCEYPGGGGFACDQGLDGDPSNFNNVAEGDSTLPSDCFSWSNSRTATESSQPRVVVDPSNLPDPGVVRFVDPITESEPESDLRPEPGPVVDPVPQPDPQPDPQPEPAGEESQGSDAGNELTSPEFPGHGASKQSPPSQDPPAESPQEPEGEGSDG